MSNYSLVVPAPLPVDIDVVHKRVNEFVDFWFKNPKTGDLEFDLVDKKDFLFCAMYVLTGDREYVSLSTGGGN